MSGYWGKSGVMDIVRVRKEVRLLGEKWGNGYSRVCKEVRLLGKSAEMVIVRVHKGVRLLGIVGKWV